MVAMASRPSAAGQGADRGAGKGARGAGTGTAFRADGCMLGDLFGLLSQAHMMDVLHVFLQAKEPLRFVHVQHQLRLSPNTLSARLKALVESGLLSRTAYNEIPPRVEYAPTAKAHDLRSVFDDLDKWAGRHTLTATPPTAPGKGP